MNNEKDVQKVYIAVDLLRIDKISADVQAEAEKTILNYLKGDK